MTYYKGEDIRINIDELIKTKEREALIKKINLKENLVKDFKILRKSLDARKRNSEGIFYVYSFSFSYTEFVKNKKVKKITVDEQEKEIAPFSYKANKAPIIVGSGPAGLFCAYSMVQNGVIPIIIERGDDLPKRAGKVKQFWEEGILDTSSNVQFGLGGAGTFSDGKLNSRIKSPYAKDILDIFTLFGASNEIKYLAKPHVGTDKIREVVRNLKEYLEEKGVKFYFNSLVTDIIIKNNQAKGVIVNNKEEFLSDNVILAVGNGARDTFVMLNEKNVALEAKPFAVGLRVEHLQEEIDKCCYGKYYDHPVLSPSEYSLRFRDGEKSCYSFCNCPGGVVIASSSEEGGVVVNGMSFYKRSMVNANSAVVVNVNGADYGQGVLSGLEFQRKLERKAFDLGGGGYKAPYMSIKEFIGLRGKSDVAPSYMPSTKEADLNELFPKEMSLLIKNALISFEKSIPCFLEGVLTGVETRTSSPIRILRDVKTLESLNIKGLYPIGEGAGYAGGILSSGVDGFRMGKSVTLNLTKI